MDPPASAVCFSCSDLILLSEEQLHLDCQAPWWDSPEPGPTGREERGAASVIDLSVVARGREAEPVPQRWSPLSAANMEHIYEEANRLARQLRRVALKEGAGEAPFVAPLGRAEAVARSPRRETYVVKDSPVRLLLPDISQECDSLLLLDTEVALSSPVSDGVVDTPCGGEDTPTRCTAMPGHKDTPAGRKAPPSRDKCTTNRSKATSGGAAHRMLAPQWGFKPKTCSLGMKQQDPRSSQSAESAVQCPPRSVGAQKAEHRGSLLVAPTSQLPRMSNTREQAGSRSQASRSGAPPLLYTGGGLPGSSVLLMEHRDGPGKPASTRVPKAALGQSAPQPRGPASDPGLRKGLCRVPVTRQGSVSVGTRTALGSGTGRPILTQTGSQ